jgi:hypothetical protein
MGNRLSAITEADQAAIQDFLQQIEYHLNILRPQRFTSVQPSSSTVSENYDLSTSAVAERRGNISKNTDNQKTDLEHSSSPVSSSMETFSSWTAGELHQPKDTESEINILNSIQADGAEHVERNPGSLCCRRRRRKPLKTYKITAKNENRQSIATEYEMQRSTHQHKP